MDDNLEKVKYGETQELTDHSNTMDSTENIKFSHGEETNRSRAFQDMKIHCRDDGSIKMTAYRKPTHTQPTYQYLLWTSEYPTAHKVSVVRTLSERASIITEEEDRQEEEKHIQHALVLCQYLKWATNKVKRKENKQFVCDTGWW